MVFVNTELFIRNIFSHTFFIKISESVVTVFHLLSLGIMDFALLIDDVLKVTENAAAFIRSQAGKVIPEKIEIKSRNSLVSYVDKEAEKIIVEGLNQILP